MLFLLTLSIVSAAVIQNSECNVWSVRFHRILGGPKLTLLTYLLIHSPGTILGQR